MVTAILFLVVLAPFHYIYESILAPDLRRLLMLKLYGLRDEVTGLRAQFAGARAELPFIKLQESINGLISRLDQIRVSSLLRILWEFRKDPGFLTRARERARLLDEGAVPRVPEIHEETLHIAARALAVNCITWTPLFGISWIIGSMCSSAAQVRLRVLAALEQVYSIPASTGADRKARLRAGISGSS